MRLSSIAEAWVALQRIIALLLLPAAVLPMLVCAAMIRAHNRGPIIIAQYREGIDGKPFRMFKLRTMYPDAHARLGKVVVVDPEIEHEWERFGRIAGDPRVAGGAARVARRYSIDEVPQLLNVIRGEMALVGPRPLPPDIAARMRPADLKARRGVLPGLTGLWQISGRGDLDLVTMGELDARYVTNRSVRRDLSIILGTIRAVLSARGAY